jgi:hypothetical protein
MRFSSVGHAERIAARVRRVLGTKVASGAQWRALSGGNAGRRAAPAREAAPRASRLQPQLSLKLHFFRASTHAAAALGGGGPSLRGP